MADNNLWVIVLQFKEPYSLIILHSFLEANRFAADNLTSKEKAPLIVPKENAGICLSALLRRS